MQDGRLLFAHYALAPNRLGYCGGNDDQTLFDYCVEGEADNGIDPLIRQFQAAYPYLKFISQANGITNPLDPKVVEAYWIGNRLLERVDMRGFYEFLQNLAGPRVTKKAMKYILGKVPDGAHPHHSFHVLDVSMRTGALRESIDDLDHCRISWGEVDRIESDDLIVKYRPLILKDGLLELGDMTEKSVSYQVDGRGYLAAPRPGDVVTVHWDWVCDLITPDQASSLERQTMCHIKLANQTLG